jgi:hypothetical protein
MFLFLRNFFSARFDAPSRNARCMLPDARCTLNVRCAVLQQVAQRNTSPNDALTTRSIDLLGR